MNYLTKKYKGIYRLRAPIDQYNQFPREFNKKYTENDIYIDCQHGNKIFHFGRSILQAYIPSLQRGHNIIKYINKNFGEDIIFNIEETDSEVLFRFNVKYDDKIIPLLKPKTLGANISPFSTKNLPKNKSYSIPDEDQIAYKNIVEKIGKENIIAITHMTSTFIKSLVTKKNTWDNIKSDMALKGLSGKNYIHSIGKWHEYIDFLHKELGV